MFKLYNKDTSLEVKMKEFISPEMKGKAAEIIEEMGKLEVDITTEVMSLLKEYMPDAVNSEDKAELMEKFQELIKDGTIPKEKWFNVLNKITDANKFSSDKIKKTVGFNIRIFKLLVDYKQLTTEWKQLFDTDYDSTFWQEQNYEEGILLEVTKFREKSRI
jgi:hypothetical protein